MLELAIEGYRLSPQQRHLWSLQHRTGSRSFRAQCAVLIEGKLDGAALRASLQNVADRHEILRTTFRYLPEMSMPLQVIASNEALLICEHDLSNVEPQQEQARIEDLYQAVTEKPFDFERGPLLHISLLALSRSRTVLLICMPAVCGDAAGLRNLVHEIGRACTAIRQGEDEADDPPQYADIAEWQNELLEARESEMGKEYWRKQEIFNRGAPTFSFQNKPSLDSGFNPAFISLDIGSDRLARIDALARKYETSAREILLACWQILLWRHIEQSETVVGVCFDGRDYAEVEGALGLFARYLPIKSQLDKAMTLRDLLKRLNQLTSDAYKWQECFFWPEINDSKGDSEGQSYFHFAFDFEEWLDEHPASETTFSYLKEYVCLDQFKVKLSSVRKAGSQFLEFYYDSALFSQANIQCLAEQYQALLESVLSDSDAPISELRIAGNAERDRILFEFNDSKTAGTEARCIHHLFEEQARQKPDCVAMVFEDQQITYGELNARANQLARHLQQRGVGPEEIVALCVERSSEMIVAILGILKAGAAYLPLDAMLPKGRLAFMLDDAQPVLILAQQHLLENLPALNINIIRLDTDWQEIAAESREDVVSQATPENLVYVLFTSGSTGQPKGVTVEHQQLFNYVNGILERALHSDGATFAMLTTFAADLGNTMLFPSLCGGGCLHMISQERTSDPPALAEYFTRNPIDYMKITPSHLEALQVFPNPEQVLPRECLILGGEASHWSWVEKLQWLAPDCTIINHYGPTETTVGVLTYQAEKNQVSHRSPTLPLGRPIARTQIRILDLGLDLVPIHLSGELYIGGANVTRGYLNRPGLTAERFVPDPFGNEPGARLYKTGDLARYWSDGLVEFLGRMDDQVKIRGFRVELGEIEAALRQHPRVRETVVIVDDNAEGNKRIVAYVVPEQNQVLKITNERLNSWMDEDVYGLYAIHPARAYEASGAKKDRATDKMARTESADNFSEPELMRFLREKLPEYMMPSALVVLNELPLMPNGKVDRRALPTPERVHANSHESFLGPRDELECQLVEMWEEILGVRPIGITDTFFELGGHSLLALRLMGRIQQQFGKDISLETLLQAGTVEHLANLVRNPTESPEWSPLLALQPNGSKTPLFLVHPVTGNALCYAELARLCGSDQPIYGLQARVMNPLTEVEAMAASYIESVRTVQPEGPYLIGGWSMGGTVACEMGLQLQAQGQKVALLVLIDRKAFDLQPGAKDEGMLQAMFVQTIEVVKAQMVKANLPLPDIHPALYQRLFRLFKSNHRALEQYVPRPYPGRVALFRAEESIAVDVDPSGGWSQLTKEIEIYVVPGSHGSMLLEPNARVLAEYLQGCIEKAIRANESEPALNQTVSKSSSLLRPLTQNEREQLTTGAQSDDIFVRRRCQILLASERGGQFTQIARHLDCASKTVRTVIQAFEERGLDCLRRSSRAKLSP